MIPLAHNWIDAEGLRSAVARLGDGNEHAGTTTIDISYNNVTIIPAYLFELINAPPSLVINVSHNPLEAIHPLAFSSTVPDVFQEPFCTATVFQVTLDVSYSTAGPLQTPPVFNFDWVCWGINYITSVGASTSQGSFTIDMAATGVNFSVVKVLSSMVTNTINPGANPLPPTLEVNLGFNNYTAILPGAFNGSYATLIDLSNNRITAVSGTAFDLSLSLQTLNLSNNELTMINAETMARTPVLRVLDIHNNSRLWALLSTGNHLFETTSATENILQCATYSPHATGCNCSEGYVFSEMCGYVRCTPQDLPHGCPSGTVVNSTDCSLAPESTCVVGAVSGQYFNADINTFLPISNCHTEFSNPNVQGSQYLAYEVVPPFENAHGTATSNRLCSVCSTCPEGYDTVLVSLCAQMASMSHDFLHCCLIALGLHQIT